MRILIVDDHAFVRAGVRAALQAAGHEVCGEAADGASAIVAFEKTAPELVLMDIRMQGMDGVAAMVRLREIDPDARIIVLTAGLSDDALVALIRQKVDGIVFKHCHEADLMKAIEAVRGGKRYVDSGLVEKAFELVSTGTPPLEEAFAQLTARERSIAELAGEGLRNRMIADRLSMTEGTVKVYLHNVYRKVGVTGRVELAVMIQNAKTRAG